MRTTKIKDINEVVDYFNNTLYATSRSTAEHFGISQTTVLRYLKKYACDPVSLEKLKENKKQSLFGIHMT